ncbi:MAG TPA: fatty acid desaturase [Tepidisphaeraceae bacterium]|jgi:stearoyl-CoA desaturase (delta-9 desaturase)
MHQTNTSSFETASLATRLTSLAGVCLPFAGFILAIVLLWGRGFGWLHCALLLGMYVTTAVGITVGYHRYFCHRSFQTPRAVQFLLAMLGSMAVEGPVLKWVAMHRCHHQHSDGHDDPHSPHHGGDGFMGVLKGMWHAHLGWVFRGDPKNLYRYIPDLSKDRLLRVMSSTWWLWSGFGLLVPTVLAGLITRSWWGAFEGFLWGGLVRVFLVHHVTWSINSVCHIWGTRPFRSQDESRNNFIFGVIGLGEGWHNNHHAFPTSARHGLRWWEVDVSYYIIRMLELVGLAWDVKTPPSERLSHKLAT